LENDTPFLITGGEFEIPLEGSTPGIDRVSADKSDTDEEDDDGVITGSGDGVGEIAWEDLWVSPLNDSVLEKGNPNPITVLDLVCLAEIV